MTRESLKEYFQQLLFAWKQMKGKDTEKLIDKAIALGYEDFWGSAPWAFKERHDTVTTTAATETVDLPSDFEGIVSLVERTSDDGRRLQKLSPDEYDRLIPYSADLSNDTPAYFKVYFDKADDVWKLALYPTPDAAISLHLTYHTIEDGGDIPAKYIGGLTAMIGKYLTMPGSIDRMGALSQANVEIERMKKIDGPNSETSVGRVLDAYQAEQPRSKKWWEEG
mgnify:CR=1 FL=1